MTASRFGVAGACVMIVLSGCSNWGASGSRLSYAHIRTDQDLQFETGANRKPTARTLYGMARILAAKGQDPKCRMVLTRILRDYPGFMPAYCDLAELHLRQGRPQDALATLAQAQRIRPLDPVILNNMGMCHLEKGEYPKALGKFTEAAAIAPAGARYRANMAIALGMAGRYEESLALYRQVLPDDHAHLNLGVLCKARGDNDRAENEFAQAAAVREHSRQRMARAK